MVVDFPAPFGPEKGNGLALGHLEAQMVESDMFAVAAHDVIETQRRIATDWFSANRRDSGARRGV